MEKTGRCDRKTRGREEDSTLVEEGEEDNKCSFETKTLLVHLDT